MADSDSSPSAGSKRPRSPSSAASAGSDPGGAGSKRPRSPSSAASAGSDPGGAGSKRPRSPSSAASAGSDPGGAGSKRERLANLCETFFFKLPMILISVNCVLSRCGWTVVGGLPQSLQDHQKAALSSLRTFAAKLAAFLPIVEKEVGPLGGRGISRDDARNMSNTARNRFNNRFPDYANRLPTGPSEPGDLGTADNEALTNGVVTDVIDTINDTFGDRQEECSYAECMRRVCVTEAIRKGLEACKDLSSETESTRDQNVSIARLTTYAAYLKWCFEFPEPAATTTTPAATTTTTTPAAGDVVSSIQELCKVAGVDDMLKETVPSEEVRATIMTLSVRVMHDWESDAESVVSRQVTGDEAAIISLKVWVLVFIVMHARLHADLSAAAQARPV